MALVARGGDSSSITGSADCTPGDAYEDMAEEARGGKLSFIWEVDPAGLGGGSGLDPLGRSGRFIRRSFK